MARETADQPLITTTPDGCKCDYCDNAEDVAVLYAKTEGRAALSDEQDWHGFICTRCAAAAIQVVTGFKVERMLEVMYRQRANARNIRLVEPC